MTSRILEYVEQNPAGSPTDEQVKWTHLRYCDIAAHLQKMYQAEVGTKCIKRILYEQGLSEKEARQGACHGTKR